MVLHPLSDSIMFRKSARLLLLTTSLAMSFVRIEAHAADEALASRDRTSSNLEDILNGPSSAAGLRPAGGSSNPFVLVDDAMTTLRLSRRTQGTIEVETRISGSGQVSATLAVGGIDRATTRASVT